MRIFKNVIKGLAFVVILFTINALLNFALEPDEGASDVMWRDYVKEEELDIVYTGSSFCLRSFNPYVIDEILGTNSYNMGTPSQAINQTYVAIKTAIEEHDLKKVILAVNYSSLESDWPVAAKVAFHRAKGKNEDFLSQTKDAISFMLDEENRGESTSVNFFFPWVYNHVSIDRHSIMANINAKITGIPVVNEAAANDPKSVYVGKGFGYYEGNLDYNSVGNENSRTMYTNEFSTVSFDVIRDIASLCKENNVELIAVNAPRPVFDVVSYGEDYFVKYERVKSLFNENGAEYYDFNLIKPEIMKIKEEYFVDMEHLNKEGAAAFSAAFAKFLLIYDGEENMDKYFYSPEEYLRTINYITNTYFDAYVQEDGILICANAYHGSEVEVEYEISLWDSETDTYEVLREYSPDKEYLYKPTQIGTYHICVKARELGKDVEYDRLYKREIVY